MYTANIKIIWGWGVGSWKVESSIQYLTILCTLQLLNITASTIHGLIISNRYCSYHCLHVYHIVYLNQKIENS